MMVRVRRESLREIDAPPVEQLAVACRGDELRRVPVFRDTNDRDSFWTPSHLSLL